VWRPVTVLAVGLVLASAAAVAAVTWAVAAVPASLAFVLGAVLASTDPVAVSALGRRLSLPPKVQGWRCRAWAERAGARRELGTGRRRWG
jgi:CPA1 family monovalent cation:H+ antiporter